MIGVAKFFGRLDDAVNPVAVKELRQSVQGKIVPTLMLLFLLIELVVIGGFLMYDESNANHSRTLGRDSFMTLNGILAFMCTILIPIYTAVRLGAERGEGTTDLLYITSLTPRQIIWGKFVSSLIVTLLIYSICAPFMTLTYLLRGIDIPSIFISLGLNFSVAWLAILVGIFIGAIPGGRGTKIFHGLLGLGMLLFLTYPAGASSMIAYSGVGSYLGTWYFWSRVLTGLALAAMAGGFLFVFSVAMISPPLSNRVMPIRLYTTFVWLAGSVLALVWMGYIGSHAHELSIIWMIFGTGIFCVALLGSISERNELSPRVRRSIPRNGLLRLVTFFFFGGAGAGVIWSCLMIALSLVVVRFVVAPMYVTSAKDLGDVQECFLLMLGMAFYSFSYAMAGGLTKRYLFGRWFPNSFTTTIAMFLLTLGLLVPLVIHFLLYSDSPDLDKGYWMITNPFALIMYLERNDLPHMIKSIVYVGYFSGGMLLLSLPWFIGQIRQFKPLKPVEKKVEAVTAE